MAKDPLSDSIEHTGAVGWAHDREVDLLEDPSIFLHSNGGK